MTRRARRPAPSTTEAPRDRLLVLNAGSSSLKFALYAVAAGDETVALASGQVEGLPTQPVWRWVDASGASATGHLPARPDLTRAHAGALAWLLEAMVQRGHNVARLCAIGHRVVHGGQRFTQPVRIDPAVLTELEALVPLAPLHQPHNLQAIQLVLRHGLPTVPQVGCFDTAFHHTQPELATRFALTDAMHQAGLRRYGFHGLSYAWIASQLPRLDPAAAAGRTIVLHLGNGASLCALLASRSIATSMGFSALDGVPMGTRCGALDPGVLLYWLRQGWDAERIEAQLYQHSGLKGVSGLSSDVRVLLASKDPHAALALDLFVYRIVREVGSLVAALGGVDALVFTAGIGEHAAPVRAAICAGLGWLGLRLDAAANAGHAERISEPDSPVRAWIIPTDEEAVIARETLRAIAP